MDHARFDALTRRVSSGFDRRTALRAGIAGFGASLAGLPLHQGAGQQASPVPDAAATTEFLFVQVATGGTWQPHPDEPDTFLLTLTGAAAQTTYFSDRPARIVGTVPTRVVLASLGFTPANPPNAAVVIHTDDGEDVLVVEVFNPVHDESAGTITYEARVLSEYQGDDLAHLASRQGDADFPETFGEVSLFIDDANCPGPSEVTCTLDSGGAPVHTYADLESCLDYLGDSAWACFPCEGGSSDDGTSLQVYWDQRCNDEVAECEQSCIANVYGPG